MIKEGDIITLSGKEWDGIVEKECQKRLGISTTDFLRKDKLGDFPDEPAPNDIRMMLRVKD